MNYLDWTLDFAARNKRPLFLNQSYYYISRTLSSIIFNFSIHIGHNDSHVFTSRGVCDWSGACARAVTRIHEFHSRVICVRTCRGKNSIIDEIHGFVSLHLSDGFPAAHVRVGVRSEPPTGREGWRRVSVFRSFVDFCNGCLGVVTPTGARVPEVCNYSEPR